ncbi:MAG: uroporphyrinogen decarboxylase [bacterium]|nr:uroporphyrinogen decarboxylase [bacterium]
MPVMSLAVAEKPLVAVLKGAACSPPPVWFLRQAGRYLPEYRELRRESPDFLSLCNTPELAARITLQPVDRFAVDAAIVFSDILIVPHGMGRTVRFLEGEGPYLTPLRCQADIDALDAEGAVEKNHSLMETLRLVRRKLDGRTTLIGFAGGPITIAAYMIDGSGGEFPATRRLIKDDPGLVDRLVARLADAVTGLLLAEIEAGADAVQIFDSWAGLLDDDASFARWCVSPTRRIVARVRDVHPRIPVIGFPRGAGGRYAGFARGTGIHALQVDQDVPLDVMRDLQSICPVQGNLDPGILLAGGEAMRRRAQSIVTGLSGGSHVFNLGHGIIKDTPPSHVADLVNAVRS